jgi:hypothetical protein
MKQGLHRLLDGRASLGAPLLEVVDAETKGLR